jgi:hypothetical protein
MDQFQLQVKNSSSNLQNAYIGAVSNTGAGTYSPSIVFGQQIGATAYAERMRIDQNGNVGIGTTTPTQNLSLSGQTAQTVWMERESTASTVGNNLTVQAGGATTGGTNLNGGDLHLSSGIATGSGSSNILLYTNGNNGSGSADSTPFQFVSIFGGGPAGTPEMFLTGSNVTPPSTALGNALFTSTTGYYNYASDSSQLKASNISASTYGARLFLDHIRGSNGDPLVIGDDTGIISFVGSNSSWLYNESARIQGVATNVTAGSESGSLAFWTENSGTLSQQMTILGNGNVGIGTTSPGKTLEVNGQAQFDDTTSVVYAGANTSQVDGLAVVNHNTGTDGAEFILVHDRSASGAPLLVGDQSGDINFKGSNSVWNYISYSKIRSVVVSPTSGSENGSLLFSTMDNGTLTDQMAILNNGNVGIGTAAPATTLDINGTARLAKNSAQPFACDATHDGAIALTHVYTFCVCNGGSTSWVRTSDGTTACSW